VQGNAETGWEEGCTAARPAGVEKAGDASWREKRLEEARYRCLRRHRYTGCYRQRREGRSGSPLISLAKGKRQVSFKTSI
jgi:hypothetical protein